MTWDGDSYQARFDERAASGAHVHGEADLVAALRAGEKGVTGSSARQKYPQAESAGRVPPDR